MNDIINVLWTGGLDSTYLIAKLCAMGGVKIQPYYIIDEERKSTPKEIDSMIYTTNYLRNKYKNVVLYDFIKLYRKELQSDNVITNAWQSLSDKFKLGTQYEWFALLAKQYNLDFMVGVLFENQGRCAKTLNGATLSEKTIGTISVKTTVNGINVRSDSSIIYEHILFPEFIINIGKIQEWNELIDMGLESVAKKTWFCHSPILGYSCGHCNPCKDALNENMEFRVSKIGYNLWCIRHFYDKTTHLIVRIIRKPFKMLKLIK